MRIVPAAKRPLIDAELQKLVDAEFDELGLEAVSTDASNVIRMREAVPPLSDEEKSFVESAAAFLDGRQNAAIILEAVRSKSKDKVQDQPAPAPPVAADDPTAEEP